MLESNYSTSRILLVFSPSLAQSLHSINQERSPCSVPTLESSHKTSTMTSKKRDTLSAQDPAFQNSGCCGQLSRNFNPTQANQRDLASESVTQGGIDAAEAGAPDQAHHLTLHNEDDALAGCRSSPIATCTTCEPDTGYSASACGSDSQESVTSPLSGDVEGKSWAQRTKIQAESVYETRPLIQDSCYVSTASNPLSRPPGAEGELLSHLPHKLGQLQLFQDSYPLYHNLCLDEPATEEAAQEAQEDLAFLFNASDLEGQVQASPNEPENDITVELDSDTSRFYPIIKGDLEKSQVFIARKHYLQQLFPGGQYNSAFQTPVRRCAGGTDTLRTVFIDMCLYQWGLVSQTVHQPNLSVDTLEWIWGYGLRDLLSKFSASVPDPVLVLSEQKFTIQVWLAARFYRLQKRNPIDAHSRCNTADCFAYSIYTTATVPAVSIDKFFSNFWGFFEHAHHLDPGPQKHSAEDFKMRMAQLGGKWTDYMSANLQNTEGRAPVDILSRGFDDIKMTKTFELEKELLHLLDWAESVDNIDPFHFQDYSQEPELAPNLDSEPAVPVGTDRSAMIPRTIWTWFGLKRIHKSQGSSGSCGPQSWKSSKS